MVLRLDFFIPIYKYSSFSFKGVTVFESGHKKPEKRKKVKGGDAGEIDNFLGPWAKYVDEKNVAKPTEVIIDNQHKTQMFLKTVFQCMISL